MLDTFPKIKKAALLIAYDNGMVFRNRSEEEFLNCLESWLEEVMNEFNLYFIEAELASYGAEGLEQACVGPDAQDITGENTMVDIFLNALFEEV